MLDWKGQTKGRSAAMLWAQQCRCSLSFLLVNCTINGNLFLFAPKVCKLSYLLKLINKGRQFSENSRFYFENLFFQYMSIKTLQKTSIILIIFKLKLGWHNEIPSIVSYPGVSLQASLNECCNKAARSELIIFSTISSVAAAFMLHRLLYWHCSSLSAFICRYIKCQYFMNSDT